MVQATFPGRKVFGRPMTAPTNYKGFILYSRAILPEKHKEEALRVVVGANPYDLIMVLWREGVQKPLSFALLIF